MDKNAMLKSDEVIQAAKILDALSKLEKGWDSYDSDAFSFVDAFMDHIDEVSIVHVSGGGVQFKWSSGGCDFEFEISRHAERTNDEQAAGD